MKLPNCIICKQEQDSYGAILFSPPTKQGLVLKTHICESCYDTMVDGVEDEKPYIQRGALRQCKVCRVHYTSLFTECPNCKEIIPNIPVCPYCGTKQ